MNAPLKSSSSAHAVGNILHMGTKQPDNDLTRPQERATSGAYRKPDPSALRAATQGPERPQNETGGDGPGDLSGRVDQNPDDVSFFKLLAEDFETHDRDLTQPGFWALAVHRFGNLRMRVKSRTARAPLSVAYNGMYTGINWLWGIDLRYSTQVGRRVRLWHHGGMVLSAKSIGNDVHIRQNTTFGIARRGAEFDDKPVIEDGVDVGVGAVIVGPITIRRNTVVGANAVVVRDTPPDSTVVGVPARPVSPNESAE